MIIFQPFEYEILKVDKQFYGKFEPRYLTDFHSNKNDARHKSLENSLNPPLTDPEMYSILNKTVSG